MREPDFSSVEWVDDPDNSDVLVGDLYMPKRDLLYDHMHTSSDHLMEAVRKSVQILTENTGTDLYDVLLSHAGNRVRITIETL